MLSSYPFLSSGALSNQPFSLFTCRWPLRAIDNLLPQSHINRIETKHSRLTTLTMQLSRPMRIQYKILAGLVISSSLVLNGNPTHSHSQFIQKRTSCPFGTTIAGGGYCRVDGDDQFVPKLSSCPFGTTIAGGGYCRVDGHDQFVPKLSSCPFGTTSAGGGYCRIWLSSGWWVDLVIHLVASLSVVVPTHCFNTFTLTSGKHTISSMSIVCNEIKTLVSGDLEKNI